MYNKPIHLSNSRPHGYRYFIDHGHPLANKEGVVYHHRHIASIKVGRWLTSKEVVHHKDSNRANNLPENLEVMSQSDHSALHQGGRKQFKPCEICETLMLNKRYCSIQCHAFAGRKVEWPGKWELKELIDNNTWVAIGRTYGVSCNAVRKWATKYGLR